MSSPDQPWTEKVFGVIRSTSGALHKVVNGAGDAHNEAGKDQTSRNSTSRDISSSSSQPPPPKLHDSASSTLTDEPSHISPQQSDPSPSDPAAGGVSSSQVLSKNPSTKLPSARETSGTSSNEHGDAPPNDPKSSQRQINMGKSVPSTSDSISQSTGTQASDPVSTSGERTSPGVNPRPAGSADKPAGRRSAEDDKRSAANPKEEPPKSEEDPGTGHKYVWSSGVAAEGGDFDAAKPGAGVSLRI